MANKSCLDLNLLQRAPEFQKMQTWYPSVPAIVLKTRLERYRSEMFDDEQVANNWFPTEENKAAFTAFMHRCARQAKIEKAQERMQDSNPISNFNAALSVYTRSQVWDAVDRIVYELERILKEGKKVLRPGMNNAQIIESFGGFKETMDTIFEGFADTDYKFIYNQLTLEQGTVGQGDLELLEYAKSVALELNTMAKFKEYLIARAIPKISEVTGIEANYEHVMADYKEFAKEEVNDDDDDNDNREDGIRKDARYIDVRMKHFEQTLSSEAKELLSNIPMVDESGETISTIFGINRRMDYSQVSFPLVKTLLSADTSNFMEKIKAAIPQYPFFKALYDRLDGDTAEKKHARQVVWSNFKKVINRYYAVYVGDRQYQLGLQNSEASDSSIVRHMLNNQQGTPLGSNNRFYTTDGGIRTDYDFAKATKRLQEIKTMLDGIEMREGVGPVDPYENKAGEAEQYKHLSGEEAMREFDRTHHDVLQELADFARGVGLELYEDDLLNAGLIGIAADNKTFNKFHNRLSILALGIKNIYALAGNGKYSTTDEMSALLAVPGKNINFAVAKAMMDDVEPRALINGKTVSALQNINVVHQVTDVLDNTKGLSADAYREDLNKEFLQYEGYTTASGTPVGFLGALYRHPELAERIELINLLSFNNVEFVRFNKDQRKLIPFIAWKKSDGSIYELPIQADYEHRYEYLRIAYDSGQGFISTGRDMDADEIEKFGTTVEPLYYNEVTADGREIEVISKEAPIVQYFCEEVLAEIERMRAISARSGIDRRKKLNRYETEGSHFNVFPAFNTNGFLEEYNSKETSFQKEEYMKECICKELQKIVDNDVKTFTDSRLSSNPYVASFFDEAGNLTATARGDFQNFSLNNYLARISLSRIYTGGFSNFENTIEFEKRNAFLGAPHTSMLIEDGPQERNVVYIGDDTTASAFLEQETQMIHTIKEKGLISPEEEKAYVKLFGNIKSTDGQGFVFMDEYVKTKEALGEWRSDVEGKALERIRKGEPKPGDLNIIYGDVQKLVGAGFQHIPAVNGVGQKPVRNPFFHKYAEIPILSSEFGKYTIQAKSTPMRGLSMAAEELKKKGIPVGVFLCTSGCKLGSNSVLDPFVTEEDAEGNKTRRYKTAKQIKDYLVSEIEQSPEIYVQKVPYKYYGKAASLPEFGVNDKITTASQAKRATFADVQPGELIDIFVDGKQKDGVWARDQHDAIELAELIDAYKEVRDLVRNKKELETIFQRELASKSYSPEDAMYALSILENGEFAAHLFTPTLMKDVESMLYSIISKRMTRPVSRGAHLACFTSVGVDKSSIPWVEGKLSEEDQLGIEFIGKGDEQRIIGIDALVPVYDSKFDIFCDENGALPPKLLRKLLSSGQITHACVEFEGYRTPSDYVHSIIPYIAKGMTARNAGGKMTESKEAMVLTGRDNDGDETNCHFPELELTWNDDKLGEVYSEFINNVDGDTFAIMKKKDGTYLTKEEFVEKLKEKDGKNKFTRLLDRLNIRSWRDAAHLDVVKYDFSASPMAEQNRSKAARDNAQLALRRAVLTSPAGSQRLILPGNNDESTIYAKTIDILRRLGREELSYEDLADKAAACNISANFGDEPVKAFDALKNLTIDEINALYSKIDSGSNPYSYSYQIDAYMRVIGGASMINVFALNSGASHLLQRANLAYLPSKTKNGALLNVGFFGKRMGALYPVKNNDQLLNSLFFARMVQSAVDNTKNPILGMLNQTRALAPIVNLLNAAGYGEEEIHLIFNQPAIIELGDRLSSATSKGLEDEVKAMLKELGAKNTHLYKSLDALTATGDSVYKKGVSMPYTNGQEKRWGADVYKLQVDLLRAFRHINSAAEQLSEIIRVTRPDASSGSVGPTTAATVAKKHKLDSLRDRVASDESRISGVDKILQTIDDPELMTDEELFETLSKNPIKKIGGLNNLMYDQVLRWMQLYLPQARQSWTNLATALASRYNKPFYEETFIREIFGDMLTWKILANNSFTGDIEQRREELMTELPKTIRDLKKNIEVARGVIRSGGTPTNEVAGSLVNNQFLRKLVAGKDRIWFNPGGVVTQNLRNIFSAGWDELIQSKYPEIRKLATDLYEYNIITNGMRFGKYEFAHLAPLSVMAALPTFSSTLDDVLQSDFKPGTIDTKNFVRQYYMNHWDDTDLIPVFNDNELPNGLREYFGYKPIDNRLVENPEDERHPKMELKDMHKYFYIRVRKTMPDGKIKDDGLYKLSFGPDGRPNRPVRVAKLSTPGKKRGYVGKHYNPTVSDEYFLEAQNQKEEQKQQIPSNDPFGEMLGGIGSSRGTGAEGDAPQAMGDPFAGLMGGAQKKQAVKEVKQRKEAAKKADKKNEEVLKNDKTPVNFAINPDSFDYTDTDVRGIESYQMNGWEISYEDEEEGVNAAEQQQPETEGKKEYYIGQPDGSDIAVVANPRNLAQARRQRAYVALRERLEKILQDKGVSIDALDDLEARIGAYGVTEFSEAHIAAEGIKVAIRLANGEKGTVALPEEFAHFALAALGYDNVLVKRLLTELRTNESALQEAFEGQYDEYSKLYDGDMETLVVEAAGKLLSKALLREQEIQNSGIRSLIRRIVEAIKNFFRRFSVRQIDDAEFDAEGVAGEMARNLLSGRLLDDLKLENITQKGKLYAKEKKDITAHKDIISKTLKVEEHRLSMLNYRLAYHKNKGSDLSLNATQNQIDSLKKALITHKTEETMLSYFAGALDFVDNMMKSLNQAIQEGKAANAICKRIEVSRLMVDGFYVSLKNMQEAIKNGEIADSANLRAAVKNVKEACDDLVQFTDDIGMQYFREMLSGFYGNDGLEVAIGKERGKKISIEEMSTLAPKDISLFSSMIHSLANCDDLVLKAIDGVVREAKQKARVDTFAIKNRVDVAFAKLVRETGSKDQEFMFEHGRDKKTGKIHRTGKFRSEKSAKKNLSSAQYEYYKTMLEIKKELDRLLPEAMVDNMMIIMVRKTAIEKAKDSSDFKEKGKYLWEAAKNSIMDTSDNIDFEHEEVPLDFRKNRVDRLTVLYTKKGKGESYDDMTDDVATAMMSYASMANEYAQLYNIIGVLENARYMANKREVQQFNGRRERRQTVQDEDIKFNIPNTKLQGEGTHLQQVLDDFYRMHVYGHLRADEGTIGNTRISKTKVAQATNALTSISQLGFNLTQRIANLSVGQAQMVIQAAGHGLFSTKDLVWATGEYMKQGGDRLMESGALEVKNYLSLFNERFDVRQDNGRIYKERKYDSKKVTRIFNGNLIYAGLTAGEDYLASVTAMALARNFKVRNAEGKEDNLWNAYEVEYLDKQNKTGAHLVLKKGWTNLDGSAITAKDERRFTNLCAGVNFDLQGIYNLDDKSAIQQYCFGSLIMMYRKWLAPALKLRYAGVHYDALRGQWEEGYQHTLGRYVWDSIHNIISEGEGIMASLTTNWDKLTPYEKSNIHKAIREFAILTGTIVGVFLLEKIPPEEKEGKPVINWAVSMLIFQLYRLRNELGAQAPTPIFVREMMKILQTPFAAVSLIKSTLDIWKLFLPTNYTTTVKSGTYKGHSKAYQVFWNMPVLSMRKQFHHFVDPTPMINYYKNPAL